MATYEKTVGSQISVDASSETGDSTPARGDSAALKTPRRIALDAAFRNNADLRLGLTENLSQVPLAAEPCRRLLDANPSLKIVCLEPDGREAVLQERRLDRIHTENASFELIFAALRDRCAVEKAG